MCSVLDALFTALSSPGTAVLHAPPGAGKTTVVPLAMLDAVWLENKQILVLEPRRLAARHAADRLAALIGERTGDTIGLRIRHERIESKSTRVLVVTEGVLTRMLQSDAELAGIGAVVFDEFHERNLHADTALALSLQSREFLRPDLRLLVMSATLDTVPVASLLGDAPVISSEGRQYPVETIYLPDNHTAIEPRGLPAFVAQKIAALLEQEAGSVLVFLPGAGEIRQTAERLEALLANTAAAGIVISQLYGELDAKSQSAAVRPAPKGLRKIVLATNIAETSLTIEGVRVVVDSGLMRENRYHPGSGMNRLQTVFVSEDSADQRRGRAGRTEPGVCYRLWSRTRHQRIDRQRRAEILNSDLSQLILELAVWGIQDPAELAWLDQPPAAAVAQARDCLQQLLALDAEGAVTTHGRQMASLGITPRLAHMVLLAAEHGCLDRACQLAAVLSEADFLPRDAGADLELRLDAIGSGRGGRGARVAALGRQLKQRLQRLQSDSRPSDQYLSAGVLLAFAYPDRIAAARKGNGDFLLASGRGAQLAEQDRLAQQRFLVVADLDDATRNARIYRAASLEQEEIDEWFGHLVNQRASVSWDPEAERVIAMETVSLGAIALSQQRLARPDAALVNAAMLEGIRHGGLGKLPWQDKTLGVIAKLEFLRRVQQDDEHPQAQRIAADLALPDLSQHWLLENLEQWLEPLLSGQTSCDALRSINLHAAIESMLDWDVRQKVLKLLPEFIEVASGSKIAIDYRSEPLPILAVRVQELFGMTATPAVLGGTFPLMLHLLSPARRPVQLTRDLEGFWRAGYSQVRSELRGRYPKHHWPENPLTATATSGTKKQMAPRNR